MLAIPTPLTPYLAYIKIALVAVVLLAAGYGGYHLRDMTASSEIAKVKLEAKTEVDAKQKQLDDLVAKLATERADTEHKVRAQEAAHAKEISVISYRYEQRLKDLKNEKARSGISISANGMWFDVQLATCRKYNSSSGAGAGISDGATASCRLSDKAAGDLLAIVDDADQVAARLLGAQEVIIEDRKVSTR